MWSFYCRFFLLRRPMFSFFFFFNDTATTEIYTLSLHDALPISRASSPQAAHPLCRLPLPKLWTRPLLLRDRKSTRLNSSHGYISYAVFCLKKKKTPVIQSIRIIPLCTHPMPSLVLTI